MTRAACVAPAVVDGSQLADEQIEVMAYEVLSAHHPKGRDVRELADEIRSSARVLLGYSRLVAAVQRLQAHDPPRARYVEGRGRHVRWAAVVRCGSCPRELGAEDGPTTCLPCSEHKGGAR
jgi:hypothetical protein